MPICSRDVKHSGRSSPQVDIVLEAMRAYDENGLSKNTGDFVNERLETPSIGWDIHYAEVKGDIYYYRCVKCDALLQVGLICSF